MSDEAQITNKWSPEWLREAANNREGFVKLEPYELRMLADAWEAAVQAEREAREKETAVLKDATAERLFLLEVFVTSYMLDKGFTGLVLPKKRVEELAERYRKHRWPLLIGYDDKEKAYVRSQP